MQRCRQLVLFKGMLPGQHLIQQHPKRPDIRSGIQHQAVTRFRAEISIGAGQGSGFGNATLVPNVGDAKISQTRCPVLRQKNISRFNIPVNDMQMMSAGQRICQLQANAYHPFQG